MPTWLDLYPWTVLTSWVFSWPSNSQCGSTLWSEPEAVPGLLFLKPGLIDDKDFMDKVGAPKKHVYCKNLWAWEQTTPGAEVAQAL